MAKANGTYQANYISSGSLAAYKAYMGSISGILNQVMARSSDSGQVNFATITTVPGTPGGTGTPFRDYEVFTFNDNVQATKPLYIRFDYAPGNGTAGMLMATVGTSTDGAGNLGGTTCQAYVINDYTTSSTVTRNCYVSSDGSYLVLLLNVQGATVNVPDSLGALVVERTRDADGTPNGNGYMVYHWRPIADNNSAGTVLSQVPTFNGVASRAYDGSRGGAWTFDLNAMIPNIANEMSGAVGATQAAYPVYGYAGNVAQGASKALMVGYQNDYPPLRTLTTVSHYGGTMQFLAMGGAALVNVAYLQTLAGSNLRSAMTPLFRFE